VHFIEVTQEAYFILREKSFWLIPLGLGRVQIPLCEFIIMKHQQTAMRRRNKSLSKRKKYKELLEEWNGIEKR
jgi:hypothetical protein